MLQSMGFRRDGHNLVTEQQQYSSLSYSQSCSSLSMHWECQLHETPFSFPGQPVAVSISLCWVWMPSVIMLACNFGGLSLLHGCGLLGGWHSAVFLFAPPVLGNRPWLRLITWEMFIVLKIKYNNGYYVKFGCYATLLLSTSSECCHVIFTGGRDNLIVRVGSGLVGDTEVAST